MDPQWKFIYGLHVVPHQESCTRTWKYPLLMHLGPRMHGSFYQSYSTSQCTVLVPGQSTLHSQGTARGSGRPSQPQQDNQHADAAAMPL
jgi:hypothetical protein